MQERDYAQIYEFGLGSLIGDFFENVKDTVKGVAKAVAPIAPFVLPFVAPALASTGIGSLLGGKVGSFLTSKLGQAALGAGIGALAGQKPADIAKNLALQVATSGVRGALSGGEGTVGQKFMSGVTGKQIPQVTNIDVDTSNISTNGGEGSDVSFLDRFTKSLGKTFDPSQRAKNPKFERMKALGFDEEKLIAAGISPESSLIYQYGPALQAGLTALPLLEQYTGPKPVEEGQVSENLYAMDPAQYQISSITGYNPQGFFMGAAEGGEVTGFAQNGGKKIQHPDGDTKEHPKRIGEIVGRGTGTSDDIPAMLSDGEFVMTAKAVRNAGGGSRKEGAKNMYKMMKSLENGGSLSQQSIGMA